MGHLTHTVRDESRLVVKRFLLLLLALIALSGRGLAQSSTGSVVGRVLDLHEALVPGATTELSSSTRNPYVLVGASAGASPSES